MARITKPNTLTKYPAKNGGYSGTIICTMTAYYPFSASIPNNLDEATAYSALNDRLLATTGLVALSKMPVNAAVAAGTPLAAQSNRFYYNAGDTRADTIIQIAGDVGTGVTLVNAETNQACKIIGITKALTTNINKWLEINSRSGEVYVTNGVTKTPAYQYHDRGFIQLAPAAPIERGIAISYTGTSLTSVTDVFTQTYIGLSVWINGWKKITAVADSKHATIETSIATPGSVTTDISYLNMIAVTPATTMSVTKLDVIYSHTFN